MSKISLKERLPLRKRKRSLLPKRKSRLPSRKRESLLRRISMLTNLPLLSNMVKNIFKNINYYMKIKDKIQGLNK